MNKEILKEIQQVIKTNKLSGFRGDLGLTEGGPYVQRLEQAFVDYFKVKHAIAFNSATAALHSVVPGNTIVSPFSFVSSASCVLPHIPIFADINPMTYCVSVDSILSKFRLDADIRAIMPVHLFGGAAEMLNIKCIAEDFKIMVIEDAAQAIGSRYYGKYLGTFGDCGVFSFNQSKQISCGEGGMLITNNDEIAYKAKLKRNHGEVLDPDARIPGYNYRMTEIESIIAYHRFLELDKIKSERQKMVLYFKSLLDQIPGIYPQWINPDVDYNWYVYSFTSDFNNHVIAEAMTQRGIPLRGGYITQPLNTLPIFEYQPCINCEAIWHDKIVVTDVISKNITAIDYFVDTLELVIQELKHGKTNIGTKEKAA